MKELCKALGIPYHADLTTSERKTSILIYDRGHVVKEVSKKDPAVCEYLRRVYRSEVEADLLESLEDSLPKIFAVVAAMLAQKRHPLDICEFLAPYVASEDKGDFEIDILIDMVRTTLQDNGVTI